MQVLNNEQIIKLFEESQRSVKLQDVSVTCTMVLNWTVYLLRPAVKRTLVSPALQAESIVLLLLAL